MKAFTEDGCKVTLAGRVYDIIHERYIREIVNELRKQISKDNRPLSMALNHINNSGRM